MERRKRENKERGSKLMECNRVNDRRGTPTTSKKTHVLLQAYSSLQVVPFTAIPTSRSKTTFDIHPTNSLPWASRSTKIHSSDSELCSRNFENATYPRQDARSEQIQNGSSSASRDNNHGLFLECSILDGYGPGSYSYEHQNREQTSKVSFVLSILLCVYSSFVSSRRTQVARHAAMVFSLGGAEQSRAPDVAHGFLVFFDSALFVLYNYQLHPSASYSVFSTAFILTHLT